MEKKSSKEGDANANVAASRRTGEHMPKRRKRVASRVFLKRHFVEKNKAIAVRSLQGCI